MTLCWECGQERGLRDDGQCELCGAPPILRSQQRFTCANCGVMKTGARVITPDEVLCQACYLGPDPKRERAEIKKRTKTGLSRIWRALGIGG